MTIQSMQLDPNAAAYTDDEIVGKVNAAADPITRGDAIAGTALGACDSDDLSEGTANLYDTGAPPSDEEIVTAINDATGAITREGALDQDSLKIVKTNPASGEFQVKNVHRDATGKLDVEYDDVAEP